MNKTAIKNFAIWARNKLIAEITYKAGLLGITEKEIKSPLSQSTQTVQFFDIGTKEPYSITGVEIEQRKKLVEEIQRKATQTGYKTAYKNVVEEVAYTWFNRLIAVRFMEVNDYLPTGIRVLSSESSNKSEPDLVTNPMDADLDYSPYEKDRIMQLKNDNQLDELFRMLFIKQCNALNAILPGLFEKTNDYTEFLMNVSFTDQEGVVCHLVHDIPEHDFNVKQEGQVEIIGWMYQYYNTEPKDETFALLKKNVKITKERIPAATQLFTPDWIVRYMVENSLGRLWIERERASSGVSNEYLNGSYFGWKYYLEEADQDSEVEAQLAKIREQYKNIKPENIKLIDPCMGSGHILVYAFDVLMQIYESYGYSQRDAAKSIVDNNLYGLDIDNRAYQLAYFAVMMKARQYNRRILNGETECHVYEIRESNEINREQLKYFGYGMIGIERNIALNQMEYLLDIMMDAKEYGSILNVDSLDWKLLYTFVNKCDVVGQVTLYTSGLDVTRNQLLRLIEVAAVMAQKFDVVVTNPPYMGSNGMDAKLSDFVKNYYSDTKSDMSTVFMEKAVSICTPNGYIAMINIPVWMFLTSYAKLRERILSENSFVNMIHLGRGIFGSDFGTTSFVLNKKHIFNYSATYCRLFERQGSVDSVDQKEKRFIERFGQYIIKQENFPQIPGMPIAYWASEKLLDLFKVPNIDKYVLFRQGMATSDNNRFLRLWYEVGFTNTYFEAIDLDTAKSSMKKWFPYNKGGSFRKWYGNNEYVVNWENDGAEMKAFTATLTQGMNVRLKSREYYFKECYSWSKITIAEISFRYYPSGFAFDVAGCCVFECGQYLKYFLALSNSVVTKSIASFLSPTLNYELDHLKKIPVLFDENKKSVIDEITNASIRISKFDWDSFEISWDYITHPFLLMKSEESGVNGTTSNSFLLITKMFASWEKQCNERFAQLKANEEELNRIFIDIYGLQDELTPRVEDKDVTIRKANLGRDIRSFISYAVACMLGRYSLDVDCLAYAGGEWDNSKYSTFIPDKDNILPITDEEYFEDDVVGLFCAFLKKTFGTETLEENLDFIAKALGNKGNSSREIIRNYFLKDFFKDHCKIYQKRPIYWLFDSGKADGFKALVYMHRYNADTIGNLRIDYLHRMQRVYESEISRMQETIENSKDVREVAAATKRKEKLVKQLKETKEYDEKIAHLALARIAIDLDDGVKVNYEKVQTGTDGKKLEVLTKI